MDTPIVIEELTSVPREGEEVKKKWVATVLLETPRGPVGVNLGVVSEASIEEACKNAAAAANEITSRLTKPPITTAVAAPVEGQGPIPPIGKIIEVKKRKDGRPK